MKKILVFLLIIIFLTNPVFTDASSSGDDDPSPPAAGGGGGGGGSPQFFDYYVPLVFNNSHKHGQSQVTIWVPQDAQLITSFSLDKSGTNIVRTGPEPRRYVFNPEDNQGLTNGSLIRVTTPSLVIGHRDTQDISSDLSFAYSILPKRMMGFEFKAPFDGIISVFTLTAQTEVRVERPSQDIVYTTTIEDPTTSYHLVVEEGSYINSTSPMIGAFYTSDVGARATMAVPKYLKGSDYVFDAELFSNREDEIDRSYMLVDPDEPTDIEFYYEDGSAEQVVIFDKTKFSLDADIRGLNATRGDVDVSFHTITDYGGMTRASSVQLIAASEMRAGEIFLTPEGLTSFFGIIQSTNITGIVFNGTIPELSGLYYSSRYTMNQTKYETFAYTGKSDGQFVLANDSLFGVIGSPGMIGHPMSPSFMFLNLPINGQTSKNITGLEATWYRFTNLAAKSIEIIPGPPEEYSGQTIKIEIVSNGSLPAGGFTVEIQIDNEEPYIEEFDFMQANTSKIFQFRRFFDLGKTDLSIEVKVDIDDDVSEITEDDNNFSVELEVERNVRIQFTIVMIITSVVIYSLAKTRSWLLNQRREVRSEIDVVIEDEVIIE